MEGTLQMLAKTADEIGAPQLAARLRAAIQGLANEQLAIEERQAILMPLQQSILNTAKRIGKARFAQVAARHIDQVTTIPAYLSEAVKWLLAS